MQAKSNNHTSLGLQIDYITKARKLTANSDNQVLLNRSSEEMLFAIEKSLVNLKLIKLENTIREKDRNTPYLKFTFISVNDFYFELLKSLDVIVDTDNFTEYKHNRKQIYVRHSKRITPGQTCMMYIEPQVNLNRSLSRGTVAIKIQLTIMPMVGYKFSTPIASKMESADLFGLLNLCEDWNDNLDSLLQDEPQFDFEGKEASNV
jgi:hypothetical protein